MSWHDAEPESFAQMLRAIAQEVGTSIERTVEGLDVDEVARAVGVDPVRAEHWVQTAAGWLRTELDAFGAEVASREGAASSEPTPEEPVGGAPAQEDPLRGATPHPLDLPSEEQGVALAALESGRWGVEPGSDSLASRGEGPAPSDALGLFRELRARDWITPEGALTLAGRHALGRWLRSTELG